MLTIYFSVEKTRNLIYVRNDQNEKISTKKCEAFLLVLQKLEDYSVTEMTTMRECQPENVKE